MTQTQDNPVGPEGEKPPAKHAGGRPRTWTDLAAMEARIADYFSTEQGSTTPTVCGLALHLNFVDRQSLWDYADRDDEFSAPIKAAMTRIEEVHERRMYLSQCVGSIFWLKNKGWKDTQTHEGQVTAVLHVSGMNPIDPEK